MQDQSTDTLNNAMIMVQMRNAFYRKKYYFALGIYFLCLLVIVIMAAAVIHISRNKTSPVYFVADDIGRLIPYVPVSTPNMNNNDVIAWVTQAVQDALSYDFVNYRGQLQFAQRYFTEYGWRNYMNGLKTSNNLLALTQRKYIIIAKVAETPKIIAEGLISGAYSWKFQMPVLITYLFPPFDDKSKFENAVSFTVIVQRQNILSSYRGLGILQMIGSLATTAPAAPMAPTQ